MLFKLLTKTYRFILVLLLLIITAIIGLAFLTITNPKFLSSLTPIIVKSFNTLPSSDIEITIGDSTLNWDSIHKIIELKITDICIIDKVSKKIFVTIKSVSIKPNFVKLFLGRISPTNIAIDSPYFFLEHLNGGDANSSFTKNFARKITELSYLHLINIHNARLINQQNILQFQDLVINFYHNRNNTVVESKIEAKLHQQKIQFDFISMVQNNGAIINNVHFTNLPSSLALLLVPSLTTSSFFADNLVNFTASGHCYIRTTPNGKIETAKFNINKATGDITNHNLHKKLSLTSFKTQTQVTENGNIIEIKNLELVLGHGMKLYGNAFIENVLFPDNNNFSELVMNIGLEKFDTEDLAILWPANLYPEAKKWVVSNIKHGIVSKGNIKVNINPWHVLANHYPANIIAGEFEFHNFDLAYYSKFPVLKKLRGKASLSGDGIHITGNGALLDSSITAAKVYVPFWPKEEVVIEAKIKGLAHNIVEFIPDPSIVVFDSITPHKAITGTANIDIKINIPLLDDINYEDIKFNIKAKLKDVATSIAQLNLRAGAFDINFTGNQVKITGTTLLNNQTARVQFLGAIHNKNMNSDFLILSSLTPSSMGINDITLSKGVFQAETRITNFQNITIKSDLTSTEFAFKPLSFDKKFGDKATLDIKGNFNGSQKLNLTNMSLKGKNIEVTGRADLLLTPMTITNANFNRIRLGYNDFAIGYGCVGGVCSTSIIGDLLDLRNFDFESLLKNTDNNGSNFNIDLKTALMKNDRIFVDIVGRISCSETALVKCNYASVTGNVGNDNPFSLTLASEDRKETWVVESDNAGLLSNGLNLYKNIKNGKLNLVLTREFTGSNLHDVQIKGAVVVNNFFATKTSIFAKIISLSSLYGVIGGYRGDNLPFRKFSADFIINDKQIQMLHGLADGHYLTLTMGGTLDMNANQLDLRGDIIPALYGMNSLLGHIPLIGKLFGGPNGGLITASYKIGGSFENSRTSINPLSIFTPGFLKNIFNFSARNKPKAKLPAQSE